MEKRDGTFEKTLLPDFRCRLSISTYELIKTPLSSWELQNGLCMGDWEVPHPRTFFGTSAVASETPSRTTTMHQISANRPIIKGRCAAIQSVFSLPNLKLSQIARLLRSGPAFAEEIMRCKLRPRSNSIVIRNLHCNGAVLRPAHVEISRCMSLNMDFFLFLLWRCTYDFLKESSRAGL